jgi:hypothetical protein
VNHFSLIRKFFGGKQDGFPTWFSTICGKKKWLFLKRKPKKSENTRDFSNVLWKTMLEVWIKTQIFFHINLWKRKNG